MRAHRFECLSSPSTDVTQATDVRGPSPTFRHRAPIASTGLAHNDILIEVMYGSMRPADLHTSPRHDQDAFVAPLLGPESIGRIVATGNDVTTFSCGDIVGVGAVASSCGHCSHCASGLEHYCAAGSISTLDYQRARHPMQLFGTSARHVVVTAPFAIRIPDAANLPAMVPLLGAGVAVYSAITHWELEPGQHVGVIGMGGLGHLAVKLAAARGANVTVFTTSPSKQTDALRFGAREAVLWNDEDAFTRLSARFDVLISTVPQSYSVSDFMALLKLNGTLINLGTTETLADFPTPHMPRGRRSIAESTGGSVAETRAVIDYCVAHRIEPEIEIIRPGMTVQRAKNAANARAPYGYVVDFASGRRH